MQHLKCPICHNLLIKNVDLVTDDPVVFDLNRISETNKDINTIICRNCKRKLKYYIDKEC